MPEDMREQQAPQPAAGGLRVAFATLDLQNVDQHFGTCRKFAIYQITPQSAQLHEVVEFPEEAMDGNEAKLPPRLKALAQCQAVYCMAVGGSAARQLLAGGTTPIRLEEKLCIETLLSEIRHKMQHDPAPWMNWVQRQAAREKNNFDAMLEESWEE
uniref:Putative nitegen fixation protein NifX-like protein n=1 Tax=Magnetococcus massalia (strain MO-1) TaxID=451514 RepID=A0A1S7LCK6_MAGMO|nr:putative nitegen fixation protein NifX-like protein [Candidatus Magnetococcus massalia]